MSVFKRAEWHSGLTYQQTCNDCHTTVTYTDKVLDFRPWYPDGFVYCPRCKTPLRHSERFAMNGNQPTVAKSPAAPAAEGLAVFYPACGKKFFETDAFCSGCGAKRR